MALRNKNWQPITAHGFAAVFLRAERHRLLTMQRRPEDPPLDEDLALVDKPDFKNPKFDLESPLDNHRRWHLLYRLRAPLLAELPPDTKWHMVSNLTNRDLGELYIIARCGWDDVAGGDQNWLPKAGKRNAKTLTTMPSEWAPPILWGHSKDGPFTIIEGNNRLAGYMCLKDPPPIDMPLVIGLSLTPFYHHIFDPPIAIAERVPAPGG